MDIKKGMKLKVIDKPANDWSSGMKRFCGQIVTILEVHNNKNIRIKEDNRLGCWFDTDFVLASNEEISRHLRETI